MQNIHFFLRKVKTFFIFVFFLFSSIFVFAQNAFPKITELQSRNPMFKQYQQEIEQNYKNIAKGDATSLSIYSYTAQKNETIMTIAARCNVTQESLATLNRISSADSSIEGKEILLPTVAGLFICTTPNTTLEHILTKKNYDNSTLCYNILGTKFCFLPGERFEPTERAFFLDSAMTSPLPQGILTSSYGMRISPISGMEKFHHGVDLAAPVGTPVLACRGGIVETCGKDNVYGNYIVLKHDNNTQSLYAHLSKIEVTEGSRVERGNKIGLVGTTGMSTGPHLHFEMRMNGHSQVPPNSLFTKRK